MGFFDFNNPQHQQLAEAHQTGNYSQLDPQQVTASYQGFVDHGPEETVQQVHQEYFNQMPKVEQMGLFSSLIDAAKQNGIDPRQAGVSTTDPHKASSLDLGNLFNLARSSGLLGGLFGGGQSQSGGLDAIAGALGGLGNQQQQQPNNADNNQNSGGFAGIGNIINNPIAQAALGGLISYAANRAFGGNNSQSNQAQASQNLPGPSSLGQPGQTGYQNADLPPTNQSDVSM
jgi:hypothetical protein